MNDAKEGHGACDLDTIIAGHYSVEATFGCNSIRHVPSSTMALYLCIAIGSGLGGVACFGLSAWLATRFGETFPWGTFAVNVTGCFIIGFFATLTGPDGRLIGDATQRHFFMTGFLGGFTTFSTLCRQRRRLSRCMPDRRLARPHRRTIHQPAERTLSPMG